MNDHKWGTVCGHWGDVLLSLQRYKEIVGEGNIVYLGPFSEIVDFLKTQSFIHDVVHLTEPHFLDVLIPVFRNQKRNWKKIFDPNNDIPEDKFISTHLTCEVNLWYDPQLSEEAVKWADEFAKTLPEVFFLIQPYSFASVEAKNHWSHWGQFIEKYVANSPFTFVLAGHNWPSEMQVFDHPRLINMVGNVPSVQHLYALSDRATGVISTSNSLAHWCVAKCKPITIMCNEICSHNDYYFRQALEAGKGQKHFITKNCSCDEAIDAARALFPYP